MLNKGVGVKMADSAGKMTEKRLSDGNESLLSSRKRYKQECASIEAPMRSMVYPENKSMVPVVLAPDVSSTEGQENAGSSCKRKHTRLDDTPETVEKDKNEGVYMAKRRKTRWTDDDYWLKMLGPLYLPDFKNSANASKDQEMLKLNKRLFDINCKLKDLSSTDMPVNAYLCQKLINEKQKVIRQLVQKNPTFKSPIALKQQIFIKKLYVPVQEYPEYNFIGLILGPRGRTKDRMEMKTGAKIMLRGKGACLKQKSNALDDEDLHIHVEATTQGSLDAAVTMVEKLLVPMEDVRNELKRSQLRELAALNNTLRVEDPLDTGKTNTSRGKDARRTGTLLLEAEGACGICGDMGHYPVACPLRLALLPEIKIDKNDLQCESCGDAGHLVVACPLFRTLLQTNAGRASVLHAPGDGSSQSTTQFHGNQPLDFRLAASSVPLSWNNSNRDVDCTNLFVANLPQHVDVGRLVQFFSPFGSLSEVKVIRDEETGLSKGYAFVKYVDPTSAAIAMNQMNGRRLDGNLLVVQVAGRQHGTPSNVQPGESGSFGFPPPYHNSAIPRVTAPACWSGSSTRPVPLPENFGALSNSYDLSYTNPAPSSGMSTLDATT